MAKVKVLKEGLTDNGAIHTVDAVVDIPDKEVERLVAAGYVSALEEKTDPTVAALKKIKVDDMKVKAISLGMEVADDIKKDDLIAAIIEAGKADAFLA